MSWTTYMILWTLGLGVIIYLISRVLFGWYNLGCWINKKVKIEVRWE